MNAIHNTIVSPAESGELEYRTYFSLSEIEGIACQWERLLASSSCNRAFSSLEWYVASCRANASLKPYLVTAGCGQELCGILPLALDSNGTARFPHLENDYNDLLLWDDDPVPGAPLLEYALSSSNCSQIVLSRLRPDSNCLRAAALLENSRSIECHARDTKRTYRYARLPASFDDYLASRSKALRKGIRRVLRDLDADGLVIQELQPNQLEPTQLPDLFISTVLARQQQKSFLRHAHIQAFVRDVLPGLFKKRSIRLFVLIKDGKVIALDMSMVGAKGLITWNGGFLPEAEPWSPGTALFAFSIREAIAEGLFDYDFGEGDEAYKLSWTNSSYVVSELTLSLQPGKTRQAIWSTDSIQPACP